MALIVNYETRGTESQPPVLSLAGLHHALSPIFAVAADTHEEILIEQLAALDPIDAHTHISNNGPAFARMLDRLHMQVLDILYVDDASQYRSSLERQKQDALNFTVASHGHATMCTTFDPFRWNDDGFPKNTIDELNRDFAQGAVAVKVWKNIGMEIKDANGQYIMPDDPVFEPIYRDIAANGKTLIIHAADPDCAWNARCLTVAGTKYYSANPQWDMSKKADAPRKKAILQARNHLLAMNPDLRVVGAHLGNMESNIDDIAVSLDLYPNFAVDTAARVRLLTLQPRDEVWAFFLKYQDRILYGTDLSYSTEDGDETTAQAWQKQYLLDWRYFSTDDKFLYAGREVQGLKLPGSILKKLYHDNATRWVPGIAAVSQPVAALDR
ncbi:MAG TPA: amidohydrolase family protein [Candidatus Angelobacter sp.]|nr:amidohydrolase family protein [Candidatus Angelobacter sp.]